MTDSNTDQAILEGRMSSARLSPVASAVDPRGRRNVVAREVRCGRTRLVPKPANDDKPEISTEFRGRRYTVDHDNPTHVLITDLEGEPDGKPTAS